MFGRRKDTIGAAETGTAIFQGAPGRLLLLKIALLLFFLIIALRLTQIQLIDAGTYQEIARRQYEAKVILPAARGNLHDRNGKLLVSNERIARYCRSAASS